MGCGRKIGPYDCCSIICGDCLELMRAIPDGCIDAVITDPPYGIGRDGSKASTGSHGGRKGYVFAGLDSERPGAAVFCEILRIAEKVIIWGGNYFADMLPATQKWLVWDKGQRIDQSDGELAWTSFSGALRILTLNRCALRLDVTEHPTQKPVKLLRWCIEQAKCSGVILDPFIGSGTTLVAARRMGLHFLGFEINEAYCQIARERIALVEAQANLFERTKQLRQECLNYQGEDKEGALRGELDALVELEMLKEGEK